MPCKRCEKECETTFCSKSCSMKYRHAHKEEYPEYFAKLAEGTAKRRLPSEGCLLCGKPTDRHYNKFCSTDCFNAYKKAHKDEYEIAYEKMRVKLTKIPQKACDNCGQSFKPDKAQRRFCSNECFNEYRKTHPSEFLVDVENRRAGYNKFRSRTEEYAEWCKRHSERMKNDNPIHDPDVLAKAMQSCKKYWDEHPEEKEARIQRFMQAPLRGRGKEWKPTSLEKKIMDLAIPGLNYVGDGSVFVTIGVVGAKRKKNPDFLLVGRKKVVEVGDEYWHPKEEIEQTVKDYAAIGYECLYLTNKDLVDRSVYETVVTEFCRSN